MLIRDVNAATSGEDCRMLRAEDKKARKKTTEMNSACAKVFGNLIRSFSKPLVQHVGKYNFLIHVCTFPALFIKREPLRLLPLRLCEVIIL